MFDFVSFSLSECVNHYSNLNCLVASNDDDAINTALINAMNRMESSVKQKSSTDSSSHRSGDDLASKKHKSQVLAKYSEVSDEELDYDDEHEGGSNALFHNTNSQEIEDREKKARELQHEVIDP
jgi:hypothetical protein